MARKSFARAIVYEENRLGDSSLDNILIWAFKENENVKKDLTITTES